MAIGDNIKYLRTSHGLSQTELGKIAGVTDKAVSTWETGEKTPRMGAIERMASYFGVTKSYIIDGETRKPNKLSQLPSPAIAENVVTFRVNTSIAAGYDQPAQPLDDWEGAEVEIPVPLLHGRPVDDYFVIRICGNSMYPQYQNGDYVLVLRTDVLDHSGQVAVMLCGEEGTIKKVEYKEGEPWYKLIPVNPQYEPKIIKGPDVETCRIIGVPKLIVREINE